MFPRHVLMAWNVHFNRCRLPQPREPRPLLMLWEQEDLAAWLDAEDIPEGLPFLLDPTGRYDVELNRYFLRAQVSAGAKNTQRAIAYDLANWLSFLWDNRRQTNWRDATTEDRGRAGAGARRAAACDGQGLRGPAARRPRRPGSRGAPGGVRPAGRVRRRGGDRPEEAPAHHAAPRPQRVPWQVRHLRVQPDKALCLRTHGNGQGPVLPDCKPLACRNVALTPANLAAWREHLTRLDQALESADVLAPYLRHRLAEQHAQLARFLDEADHTGDGSA